MRQSQSIYSLKIFGVVCASLLALCGCGGSGSSATSASQAPPVTTATSANVLNNGLAVSTVLGIVASDTLDLITDDYLDGTGAFSTFEQNYYDAAQNILNSSLPPSKAQCAAGLAAVKSELNIDIASLNGDATGTGLLNSFYSTVQQNFTTLCAGTAVWLPLVLANNALLLGDLAASTFLEVSDPDNPASTADTVRYPTVKALILNGASSSATGACGWGLGMAAQGYLMAYAQNPNLDPDPSKGTPRLTNFFRTVDGDFQKLCPTYSTFQPNTVSVNNDGAVIGIGLLEAGLERGTSRNPADYGNLLIRENAARSAISAFVAGKAYPEACALAGGDATSGWLLGDARNPAVEPKLTNTLYIPSTLMVSNPNINDTQNPTVTVSVLGLLATPTLQSLCSTSATPPLVRAVLPNGGVEKGLADAGAALLIGMAQNPDVATTWLEPNYNVARSTVLAFAPKPTLVGCLQAQGELNNGLALANAFIAVQIAQNSNYTYSGPSLQRIYNAVWSDVQSICLGRTVPATLTFPSL